MSPNLNFIGQIRTPYNSIQECPSNIQFDGPVCDLDINEEYANEIRGLNEGDHILILYWLGRAEVSNGAASSLDENSPGAFALRTPIRPNPIGVAVLPIEEVNGKTLSVKGLDCLDKTELIDIKPVIYLETGFSKK